MSGGASTDGIFCADGVRHYGPDQVKWFGAERLVTQSDFAGCGPHRSAGSASTDDAFSAESDLVTIGDPCPDCGAPIVEGDNWSGIKCSNCRWWFCF